jgi:hypothetical protein
MSTETEPIALAQIRAKTTSKSTNKLDQLIETENNIKHLKEILPGDHIVLVLGPEKYLHTILNSVYHEIDQIECIFYDNYSENYQPLLAELLLGELRENAKEKSGIKQSLIRADLNKIEIYKINYDEPIILTPEQTLAKARKYVGQTKYNIFANNDEHFAIYCKTGKAAKLFIIDPKEITARNIIGKSVPEKLAQNLAQESGQIILVNTAKHVASRFPRTAASTAIPVAAEAAGALIGKVFF